MYRHVRKSLRRAIEVLERIAAADIFGGVRVNRLQAQFHPDGFCSVELLKKSINPLILTVGARCDGEGGNVLALYRFGEHALEIFNGCVG